MREFWKAEQNTVGSGSSISLRQGIIYAAGAVGCFHLAYASPGLSAFILGYLFCLIQLGRLATPRQSFYTGVAVGFLTAAPQLYCFWTIFGPGAIVLWLVLGFWSGLFVAMARLCRLRFPAWTPLLVPMVWTGLEYFRSELYYLRFSWLNVGYAFAGNTPFPWFHWLGMYGIGFVVAALAATACSWGSFAGRMMVSSCAVLLAAVFLLAQGAAGQRPHDSRKEVNVAGVQLEFPTEQEVLVELRKLVDRAPGAELLVLSEYTFLGDIPAKVKSWCREHHRYLIVGGKDPAQADNFYDTAFVIAPNGEVIFKQAKSVPIQFFKDGLPASRQAIWDSPWGRIGICICYDLSYTRVTDALVRLGAQAIIVPTMDVADWGSRQHQLHARVARVRATEYSLPIFRVASSGISQLVNERGMELATAGFPGQQEVIRGKLELRSNGSRPIDRWLAPACVWATGALMVWFVFQLRRRAGKSGHSSVNKEEPVGAIDEPLRQMHQV